MRGSILIFALAFLLSCYGCSQTKARTTTTTATVPVSAMPADSSTKPATGSAELAAKIDFTTQVKPIFAARCQPCHFNGGTMYKRLPFDRPETIKTLGTKLFTRIKDENERRLIRDFLAQE